MRDRLPYGVATKTLDVANVHNDCFGVAAIFSRLSFVSVGDDSQRNRVCSYALNSFRTGVIRIVIFRGRAQIGLYGGS